MKLFLLASIILFSSAPSWGAMVNNPNCQDLVEVNDKFTPEYMAVLDGYSRRKVMTNEQLDIAGLVTESGKVKDQCAKDKTAKIQDVRKKIETAKTNAPANTLQEDIDRKPKSTINPTKAKCSDFIALDEQYQPVAAYWVAGHTKAGKVSDGQIDEVYLEQPVTTLIEESKAQPTASFYQNTKTWFKKHI